MNPPSFAVVETLWNIECSKCVRAAVNRRESSDFVPDAFVAANIEAHMLA
ncbi:hypothetical protein ACDY96_13750 [Rhizobium mongolense]